MTENGQPALVSGASSGIGLEPARQFVTQGFDLIIAAEDDAEFRHPWDCHPSCSSSHRRRQLSDDNPTCHRLVDLLKEEGERARRGRV
jgi:NAD(P)-dependent dehydrogenase (short-subunit alcohol dehydrogenase family)